MICNNNNYFQYDIFNYFQYDIYNNKNFQYDI